jgi:hypothetical protein
MCKLNVAHHFESQEEDSALLNWQTEARVVTGTSEEMGCRMIELELISKISTPRYVM